MKHIVCYSGGKDSTALLLWAKKNLGVPGVDWTAAFCDTGWEHPITYAYIEEIDREVLGGTLVRLKSKKYPDGFVQLVTDRRMIPGVHSRFCTQELKVFPLQKYFEGLMDEDEVTSYQGIRADESFARSKMEPTYWEPTVGYWIKRPLLNWSAEDCFAIMKEFGVKPNPLYLMGSSRVGCWPCIMTGLGELKRAYSFFPEIKQRLIDLERLANETAADPENPRTWFKSDKIPERYRSKSVVTKDGRTVGVATVEDVFAYIEATDADQIPMFPAQSCLSLYNLCE